MKTRNKLLLFALSALLVFATARFCHHKTAGFRISKITDNTFDLVEEFPKYGIFNREEYQPILAQKFTYLGRGLQSFAFVSEDQKYVLKICHNRPMRRIFWLNSLPCPSFLKKWQEEKSCHFQKKLAETLASYELAFKKLKEETGLIFIHPYKTSFLQTRVTLVDKIGIAHQIDLDKTAFLLQKKAVLVYPKLLEFREKNDLQGAERAISSLFALFKLKSEKGIGDKDPLIRTNFGFLEDRAVEIDVGPFYLEPTPRDPAIHSKEILRITCSLREWVHTHYPALLPHVEKERSIF